MYLLYSLAGTLALLLLSPYFYFRDVKAGEFASKLRQRLGTLPAELTAKTAARPGGIWIHAVSVGEVLAAQPLAQRLKEQFPERPLLLSTTTATGRAIAMERLPFADGIFYFPVDLAWVVRRFLRALSPALIIIVETEIWPNLLRQARRTGIPVMFCNARISDRSYPRYRLANQFLNRFTASALGDASLFLAQSDEDARRLRELGADEDSVEVTGNLKFDLAPPPVGPFADWLREQLRRQERWPVLVAGSLALDEIEPVLAAYDLVQRIWRHALLVLAPRKPAEFESAAELTAQSGWKVIRRGALRLEDGLAEDGDILLLDSIGELGGLYSLAEAVFVGGSLAPVGGHNLLEPAFFRRVPVFGPHMESFRGMAAQFLSQRAGIQVRDGNELGRVWEQLIREDRIREELGAAARAVVERHRGATERTARHAANLLGAGESGP